MFDRSARDRRSQTPRNIGRLLPIALMTTLVLGGIGVSAAWAQPVRVDGSGDVSTGDGPTAPCEDGIVRDDGSAETAWGWVPTVVDGRYVQEFALDEMPSNNMDRFCVCWRRTNTDTEIDFEVHFYRHERFIDEDDGTVVWVPELEPYAVVPAHGSNITDEVAGTWVEVDLGGVEPPIGPYFSVGVKWDPSQENSFFVCGDTTVETPRSNVWFIDDRASGWTSVLNTIDPIFNVHRAFMMRLVPGPQLPAAIEVPGPDVKGLLILALAIGLVAAWVVRRL